MYTKQDLKNMIKEMGIASTDTLFIHSSMKAIGEVLGGADTVLDSFMEYLENGLLILPTHTWGSMSETHNVYDPNKEPACVGLLPNLFMKREGVVRSLHPTHSVAAYGKDSMVYIKGEEEVTTPCAVGGCYDRLRERNAKILLLGVNHNRNTFIHCVEEILEVPERLTEKPVLFKIVMPDGSLKESYVYRHYNRTTPHISEAYTKLEQAFYDNNVAKQVKFGDATCILCDANGIFEVTKKVLSHQINCLMELDEIPKEWWE
ncbi:MAG: AAC(3) family N-acetyltransferase [Clostridiales bacterium]|jgi:aminoglycoside 3-N-acetyltransferase|nr:AAC(3) family N-acetyltransferase [Clostridiales bacterium]